MIAIEETKLDLTELEERLLNVLVNPVPPPKYQVWQECRFLMLGKRSTGLIVGMYWASVEYAYHNSVHPGWYYVVLSTDSVTHYCIEEQDIKITKPTHK